MQVVTLEAFGLAGFVHIRLRSQVLLVSAVSPREGCLKKRPARFHWGGLEGYNSLWNTTLGLSY